jgi:hypothetical protein
MNNVEDRWNFSILLFAGLCCALIATADGIAQGQPLRPDRYLTPIERMGMIESTDRGATWNFKGHADFHAPALNPVDPSVLFDNGMLVFYFYDLMTFGADSGVVYRSVATNDAGLDFSLPSKAFQMPGFLTDPAVVKTQNGKYRMYVQGQNAIVSAGSDDGVTFTLDPGERTRIGGVPGAIVLPDGRVRLYVSDPQGITSLISSDGLSFTPEPGVRIPGGGAPSPIQCTDSMYRMAYAVAGNPTPWQDQTYFAESPDAFSWTIRQTPLVKGSVPTLVELPNGRLRIYYVDFQSTSSVTQVPGIPAEYCLEQNYPNPFNPKTGIRYQVPGVSDVKITVYDILGREIAVLLNERKAPGSYEVTFEGSNIASGVYFYRLFASPLARQDLVTSDGRDGQPDHFVDTKKLLLVK